MQLGWSCTKFSPHSEIFYCKVKPNRLMISTSTISPLAFIVFLKNMMWALGLVSFAYVGYWSFRYGSLLVALDWLATSGYDGGTNILESGANHPWNPTCGSSNSPLSGFWSNDPPLGESLGGSPHDCGCQLILLGYLNTTSLPQTNSSLATCMLIGTPWELKLIVLI